MPELNEDELQRVVLLEKTQADKPVDKKDKQKKEENSGIMPEYSDSKFKNSIMNRQNENDIH